MPTLKYKIPSYCHHKASGQAVVTLSGHDNYLGPYGSDESRARYDELIAKWLAHGKQMPGAKRHPDDPVTINELAVLFWDHAETYYRKPDGTQTTELSNLKAALTPLVEVFGETKLGDFGPKSLKALQQHMISLGCTR